ncbi:hypothetical protein DFH29DRAFT_658937 [Suillus ampliporus]|nr:hypothetical protein DFH29DRAFT_658937 [Suillus ampliporus]
MSHPLIRTLSLHMHRLSRLPCLKTACIQRCRIRCVVHAFILSARNAQRPKGVRAAALKYPALLPGTVRYDLLYPYKTRVLKELAKTLDDPKRAVRKETVVASSSGAGTKLSCQVQIQRAVTHLRERIRWSLKGLINRTRLPAPW